MTLSLPHTLTTVIDAGTKARAAKSCLTMGLAYLLNFPIDTLGDVLVDDVEAEVLLKLRSSVMATVLSQDREYFDAHQVGELQERLNRDTAEVARSAIAQPKALLSILTRIATNSGVLLTISPRLAWLALCVPVPFSIFVAVISLKQTRRQNRKVGRVNDRAAAGTIEVLREVSTVRQFGMERVEVAKFCETATWRMQLERRLRVSSMITQYTTLQAFEASRLLNIFWGVGLVVSGELEPTRLLMAVINLQQVVNNTRGLFNLLPQFFMVMEPLERLATLLESRPKIEPPPTSCKSTSKLPLLVVIRRSFLTDCLCLQTARPSHPLRMTSWPQSSRPLLRGSTAADRSGMRGASCSRTFTLRTRPRSRRRCSPGSRFRSSRARKWRWLVAPAAGNRPRLLSCSGSMTRIRGRSCSTTIRSLTTTSTTCGRTPASSRRIMCCSPRRSERT